MALKDETQYVNQTPGWLGVVKLNPDDSTKAVSVPPGGHVFLSEDDVKLTIRAQTRPDLTSPFGEHEIKFFDQKTGELKHVINGPMLKRVDEAPQTGGAEQPTGDAPQGKAAVDEEVATPDAPKKRRPAKKAT